MCFRSDFQFEGRRKFGDLLRRIAKITTFMQVGKGDIFMKRHVNEYSVYHQEPLPAIEDFISTYLKMWNGMDYRDTIFSILSNIRPRSYESE